MNQTGCQHYVRYGTSAEQRYMAGRFESTYDCIVVNANMVSHAPAALAAFIGQAVHNKPFFMDPQTHAFQHDITLLQRTESISENEEGGADNSRKLRRSIQRLVDAYGDPIRSRISAGEVVLPDDFRDAAVVQAFAERVAQFQLNELRQKATEQGLVEYYEFAGVSHAVRPVGIVAPYFFMDQTTVHDWIDINIAMINSVARSYGEAEVLAQLVISKDLLYDEHAFQLVVDRYREVPAGKVLLWIDSFSEHEASAPLLKRYANLVRDIGQQREVAMLYGSYFSVALARFVPNSGLAGVCHGLEYGEDRAVIPAIGGLPVSKFYYPAIHKRVRFPDAFRMARPYLNSAQDYLAHVCRCYTCQEVMTGQDPERAFGMYGKSHPVTFKRRSQVVTLQYPDTDTRDRCVRHYMWNKAREFREETSLGEVIDHLQEAYEEHKRTLGLAEVGHCKTWAQVLKDLGER